MNGNVYEVFREESPHINIDFLEIQMPIVILFLISNLSKTKITKPEDPDSTQESD